MIFDVTSNVDRVKRQLSEFGASQVPFATALAMNEAVDIIKRRATADLERKLDRPTPFTKRAYAVRKAAKRRLEARVFAKDRQAEYLSIQETGGVQRPKRQAFVLPVEQKRNKYGNIPRGRVKRLLARRDTFSARIGQAEGIWRRLKSGRLKFVIGYRQRTEYEPRLGFLDLAERTARRAMPAAFVRTFRRAVRTSR